MTKGYVKSFVIRMVKTVEWSWPQLNNAQKTQMLVKNQVNRGLKGIRRKDRVNHLEI